MKRPLVGVAICYATGVVLAAWLSLPPWPTACAAVGFALASLFSERGRSALVAGALLFCGAANLGLRIEPLSPFDLRHVAGDQSLITRVRARLLETPIERIGEGRQGKLLRTTVHLRVEALKRKDAWERAEGTVMASMPGPLGRGFWSGRRVEVEGVLDPPREMSAPGGFDYRRHLNNQGVFYQFRTRTTNDWTLLEARGVQWSRVGEAFTTWAQHTLARGLDEQDETVGLTWALALGWQTGLTAEVADPFMRSGTMHVFAISGLHIVLIASILFLVLKTLRVPRTMRGLIVLPLIWFYTGATGWQPSAIRSAIMSSVILLGYVLRRPGHLTNSLAVSALLILIWDPCQAFSASFQLSFFVVLAMAVLIEPMDSLIEGWLDEDPLLPLSLLPTWRRWLNGLLRWTLKACAVSIAAWIGSAPLIAWYFHLLTPVSVLANLIVVPLSDLVLAGSLASLALNPIWPGLGVWLNQAVWLAMIAMVEGSRMMAMARFSAWHLQAPPELFLWIFYCGFIAVAAGLFELKRGKWIAGALGVAAAGTLVAQAMRPEVSRITVLPTGAGDAIWCDMPGTRNDMLVDAGDSGGAGMVIKPFLKSLGVNTIPQLLITHGDASHVAGAPVIMGAFRVAQVATSPHGSRSPYYRQFLKDLRDSKTPQVVVEQSGRVAGWEVLHPGAGDKFTSSEDAAIVLRRKFTSGTVLMVSDLGKAGLNKLSGRQPDLGADVLVVGMPSRGEPVPEALLQLVKPRVIIVSSGEYPANQRPRASLKDRLARTRIPIFYTGEDGAITIDLLQENLFVKGTTAGARQLELSSSNRGPDNSKSP